MRPRVQALMRRDSCGCIVATPYLIWFGRSWRVGPDSVAVFPGSIVEATVERQRRVIEDLLGQIARRQNKVG